MKNKPILAIIGGGASGMTAAIFAARKSKGKIKIIILEKMDRVGKKILATGNGRCNFSNIFADCKNYHGKSPEFTSYALSKFNPLSTIDFFASIGVLSKQEQDGRIYPYCDRASSVLDALRFELDRLGVEIRTSFKINEIIADKSGFKLISKNNPSLSAQRIIIAAGGCASPNLGSDGSGFELLRKLSHKVTKLSPALVQLKTEEKEVRSLKGIKFIGKASAYVNDKKIADQTGEILFTDYGLSGIPIFQLSVLTALKDNIKIKLDFMPEYSYKEVYEILISRRKQLSHLRSENFFNGLINNKIGCMTAKKSGIEKLSLPVKDISDENIKKMAALIKQTVFNISGTKGFENAQVTAGGVLCSEFDDKTMQSKLIKGLYCTGEIYDIWGDCGGFNLQWAFSSAFLAAESAVNL